MRLISQKSFQLNEYIEGRTIHEILSEKMDEAFQRRQRQKITGKIAANAMSNGKNELDWSSA